ncbi:hypothetical protein M1L60_07395 [Actinoplanes sp. TRM 88003]|uniref:Uncharacterized protein n=1 Tax=Paractinoplanes aksuensis TaxID=2939490 RepID=A0ABT1DHZ7_9ACTN|nr:hypothetical protein [Actinoplanes aksuensis]MCO8270419.1 hypothetical protein [Actinoplanes aksuensis]
MTGAFGRLYPLRLVDLAPGLDPVLWFTGLGVIMCLGGVLALRLVQGRVSEPGTVRRGYQVACLVAAAGVVGLAAAPGAVGGSVAVLVAAGALPLTRSFATIRVNRKATPAVRSIRCWPRPTMRAPSSVAWRSPRSPTSARLWPAAPSC